MSRLSAADQAAFRRWANSLGCVCKICNHTAASIQAFVTHLRQAHDNMSTATYTNMHGPYTTVHKCKLCGNELNGGFNDLKDHLNRRHNGMTITSKTHVLSTYVHVRTKYVLNLRVFLEKF